MGPVIISCPQCGKELKLRDRKLLGKRGKCPKCQHRFLLQEPEEVELELADADAAAVGTSARWVPDEAASSTSSSAPVAMAPQPVVPQIRVSVDETPLVGSRRSKVAAHREKQKKLKLWVTLGSTVSGIVLAAVIALLVLPDRPASPAKKAGRSAKKAARDKTALPGNEGGNEAGPSEFVSLSVPDTPPQPPPPGKPVTLKFIPTGARLIIHLRPAELWQSGSPAETVRFCLGPVGVWAEQKLKELLLFEPQEIKEAVIALYLDDKTQPPRVAYWVKLTGRHKPSDFIERFKGMPNTDHGRKIYLAGDATGRAYMITDKFGESFASAPAELAGDMVLAADAPGLPGGGLEELLKQTDRNRHLTILFNPRDLRDFRDHLFPKSMHDLLGHFLDRFEDEKIEAVAWSVYLGGPQYADLYSELVLRNRTALSPRELQLDMNRKFRNLPDELLAAVRHMRPKIMAERQLVSRLPVMFKAVEVETLPSVGSENERYVKFTTALPQVAGPNLAAASLLAWRLARMTDFTKPHPSGKQPSLPARVADRLKQKIEIDFRRLPLQEAFAYIASETQTKVEIDGDALKDAGYTKNMPQTMKLGEVPGLRAIHEIIKKYEGMVIVVDEQRKTFIVTTEKFAKMKGQKPFPVAP